MLNNLVSYLRAKKYLFNTIIVRLFFCNSKVKMGSGVRFASVPRLIIKSNASLKIGNNVFIGSGVDLRVYADSSLIIEDNCKIDDGVRIIAANRKTVFLDSNTKIGFHSVINGGGGVHIGKNCSTYGFVYIQSSSHEIKVSFSKDEYKHEEVLIGDSVLIGPHAVIQQGSYIPSNTVLQAFSKTEKNKEYE